MSGPVHAKMRKIYNSPTNLYIKCQNYELWGHLTNEQHLLIQLKTFTSESYSKVFAATFEKFILPTHADFINPSTVFEMLSYNRPLDVDLKNGFIYMQAPIAQRSKLHLKSLKTVDNYSNIKNRDFKSQVLQIKLLQIINEPSFDNWLLISILKQTSSFYHPQSFNAQPKYFTQFSPQKQHQGCMHKHMHQWQQGQKQKNQITVHEGKNYRFQAQLDLNDRKITTLLVVKNAHQNLISRNQSQSNINKSNLVRDLDLNFSRLKLDKVSKKYKSVIRQSQWPVQYQQEFKCIERLFQHLKDRNNYQVLQDKGIIKIKTNKNSENQSMRTTPSITMSKVPSIHNIMNIHKEKPYLHGVLQNNGYENQQFFNEDSRPCTQRKNQKKNQVHTHNRNQVNYITRQNIRKKLFSNNSMPNPYYCNYSNINPSQKRHQPLYTCNNTECLHMRVQQNEFAHCQKQQNNLSYFKTQIEQIKNTLNSSFQIATKQIQFQYNKSSRQQFQRYDQKFLILEKQLKKYVKNKIKQDVEKIVTKNAQQITKIKEDIVKDIAKNIGGLPFDQKINMRKSHVFQVIRPQDYIQKQMNKKDIIKQNLSTKQNKFMVDESKSSQFSQFKIQQNEVKYQGSWEWTQLFTNKKIVEKKERFHIKIIKTLYNAIAIGISSPQNIISRSSLTKKRSISYWGDGQIWQGNKIRIEGKGFSSGDNVVMQVNRVKGQITWSTNGKTQANYQSTILKDENTEIYAYIEMYDAGDIIKLIKHQII